MAGALRWFAAGTFVSSTHPSPVRAWCNLPSNAQHLGCVSALTRFTFQPYRLGSYPRRCNNVLYLRGAEEEEEGGDDAMQ